MYGLQSTEGVVHDRLLSGSQPALDLLCPRPRRPPVGAGQPSR